MFVTCYDGDSLSPMFVTYLRVLDASPATSRESGYGKDHEVLLAHLIILLSLILEQALISLHLFLRHLDLDVFLCALKCVLADRLKLSTLDCDRSQFLVTAEYCLADRRKYGAVDCYFGELRTVCKRIVLDRCHMLADRDTRHFLIAFYRIFANGRYLVDYSVFIFHGIRNLDGLACIFRTRKFNGRCFSALGYFVVVLRYGKLGADFLGCRSL